VKYCDEGNGIVRKTLDFINNVLESQNLTEKQ